MKTVVITEQVKDWVREYYDLLVRERDIGGMKREIARHLIYFFKKMRKVNPGFVEFEAGNLKCVYVEPEDDRFDVRGLYKALSNSLPPEDLQTLFPRTVDRHLLSQYIQSGKIDPAVVAKYYRPVARSPYIRVHEK